MIRIDAILNTVICTLDIYQMHQSLFEYRILYHFKVIFMFIFLHFTGHPKTSLSVPLFQRYKSDVF